MATISPFLQSPFQALIDQQNQPAPMPGSDPVKEVEIPAMEAAVVEQAPAPVVKVAAPKRAKSSKPQSLAPPEELRPLFATTAEHFGVPENILMAIAQQESGYSNGAVNGDSGASGMVQYMDSTAKSLGINKFDPNESIPAAALQIRERLDKGMSMEDAVKEHFAGPNRALWKDKTHAYGKEVLEKAERIDRELYGNPVKAPEPENQNGFAPDRMARTEYEANFKAMNPQAKPAALAAIMAQYDEQAKTRTKAKGNAVQDRFATLQSPEAMFDAKLDAKLQGGNKGVAQALPDRQQPVDVNSVAREKPGVMEQAGDDFGRGVENLKALGYGAAGLAADASGNDEAADRFLTEYVAIQDDIAKNNPATIGTYKNVESLGDAGRYAIEAVMENLPMLLPSLVSGGIGAQIAKKGAERLVGGMIAAQVARNVPREIAEQQAAKFVLKRITLGSIAGAAPASVGMESGSIMGDIYQETGEKRSGLALGYGIPAGLLDTLQPVMALRKIAGPIVDEVAGGIVKRLGVEGAKQFMAEAGTEGLQTIIEQAAAAKAANRDLMTPELLDNVIDAMLKGGIGGAVIGGASQGINEARRAIGAPAANPQPVNRIEPVMGDIPAQAGTEAAPAGPMESALQAAVVQDDADQWTAEVMGDDGLMHRVDSRTGVEMTEPAPFNPDTVRLYHGGEPGNADGSLWFSREQKYAQGYADKSGSRVWYVDVPADHPLVKQDEEFGVLPPTNVELPAELARMRQPLQVAAPKGPLESAVADAAELHALDPAPAPMLPEPEPAAPDYSAMPMEDLRARLKEVAQQAKASPEALKALAPERKQIEQAVAAKVKQAKQESKPAEAPLTTGPFDDIKQANREMIRHIEAKGVAHQVVESNGKFTVAPLEEANNGNLGLDNSGAVGRLDGVGRSGANAAGLADGNGVRLEGDGNQPVQPRANDGKRVRDVQSDPADAARAADAQPALTDTRPAENPYRTQEFPSSAKAEAFVAKKGIDLEAFEIVQTGEVRWQVLPRLPKADAAEKAAEPINLVRLSNAEDFDWNRAKPNGTYASIADDPDSFASPFADDYKDGKRYDMQYQPKNPLQVGELKVKHSRFGRIGAGDASAGVKALHAYLPQEQFDAALKMSKAEVQAEIASRFPDVDSSTAYDSYEALEIWGAQEAKAKGHDIIIARDGNLPAFSEAVLLEGANSKPTAKESANVSERAKVSEEAPTASGKESAQQADRPAAKAAEPAAGTDAAPAAPAVKPKRKLSSREVANAKQDEAVRKAAESLAARKAANEAKVEPPMADGVTEPAKPKRKKPAPKVAEAIAEPAEEAKYSARDDIAFSTASPEISALIQGLADGGGVVVHADSSTLPGDNVPDGVQAMTEADGTIHLVASSLTDANAHAVLLHEAFHAGAEKLIGSPQWNVLLKRLGSLYRQGEQSSGKAKVFFDAARRRVVTAKAKGAVADGMEMEEFGAYAIEEYESAPPTVRKWVDDLVGMVKSWMLRRFGRQLGQVTPAQLSALAKLALLDVRASRAQAAYSSDASKTIQFDGKRRPIENSKGQIIAEDMNKQLAFYRWFKDSAVVDEQQRPLVVYHGTTKDFAAFDAGRSKTTGIFFSATPEYANIVAELDGAREGGAKIIAAYVRISNPMYVNANEFSRAHTKEAKEKGHDGLITLQDGQPSQITVFSPEQIKSAVGNNGQFDPANPDVRFSVSGAPQPRTLTPPEQGLLRRVQAQLQDGQNRIKQVQENIRKVAGVTDLGGADHYLAETNRPGRIAAKKEDARDKLLEPMMKRLAKAGYTPKQLDELLHAQHAEERNAAVAAINPEFPDGGSGLTNAQAQAVLARYVNEGALLRLADEARNIARETLALKKAYGLITDDQHDTLAVAYANYVPLKGDGEYGPKVRRAMGHNERDEHILENIARDYEQAIVVGEKNFARHSLARMVLQFPDDALWTARVPPKGRYVAGTVFSVKHKGTGDVEATYTAQSQVAAFLEAKGTEAAQYEVNTSDGESVVEFTKPLQDNEVMVYIKGSPVRLQIFDETLARQLRPLKSEQMNAVLDFMRAHNRYLSMIFTGYNPAFIIKNATRDAITGTLNMTGNHGIVTSAKAWARYPMAWATMLQWAATKNVPNTPMGQMLTEYRNQGGKVGASYMSDLEEQGKSLQRMFDDEKGVTGYAADGRIDKAAIVAGRKTIMGLAHVVEVLNQAFENALRLALFAQLRTEGKKPGVAAASAKSVTVNFDRKGAMTNQMGAFYLFINPAIQGTANAMTTLTKGENKGQAWALAGMMAAAGFAMAAHGMDDDKDRWLGEKWDTRTKNLRFRIGETTINIPMSQEFAPFYSMGVAMGEVSRGESSLRASVHTMSSFLDAYYPMQGAIQPGSDNPAMDLLLAHIPTVGKMPAQVAANRNSFGSKVVPESDNTKNRPDNLKMNRGTKGSVYDSAAQALAVDGYENDLSKVSPETLKLIWGTYTGGIGRFVADSIGSGNLARQADIDMDASDIPIIKDFVKPDKVNPIRSRFYDLSDEARNTIDQFTAAKKAMDGAAMKEIAAKPGAKLHLGLAKMVKKINEIQGLYADQAVSINADKNLTTAEKRAKLKEIEQEQEAIYRKAIAAFSQ